MRPSEESPAALPASFRRLLVGWAGSLTGDGLRVVALPLLAASIDPSAGAVATVAVAATLPWLLVAIPAGAMVDRLNPAKVMATAHLVRAVATLALAALIVNGSLSILELAIFGFVITSAETFADGSAQSLVVRLVPSADLERANARFVTVETIALDMAGPLAAGVLFLLAPWLPFGLSAVCFLLAAATVITIPVPAHGEDQDLGPHKAGDVSGVDLAMRGDGGTPPDRDRWPALDPLPDEQVPGKRRPGARPSAFVEIGHGLQRLLSDPVLRVLVLTVGVMVIANAAADAVLVLYGTRTLSMSEATYPLLLVAYSIGILASAALVGHRRSRLRGGQTMMIALFGISATMLALGLFPHVAVALVAYGVMGLAGGTWNVLSATRRQRRTPKDMIARVSSAFRVVAWGFMPVGAALGGVIGERWGVPAVYVLAGAVIAVLGLVVTRSFVADEPDSEPEPQRVER